MQATSQQVSGCLTASIMIAYNNAL